MSSKWIITSITTVVLITLGGLLLIKYGNAKFNEGYAKAQQEVSDKNAKTILSDKLALENINAAIQKMPEDVIDTGLINLNIMRDNEDY